MNINSQDMIYKAKISNYTLIPYIFLCLLCVSTFKIKISFIPFNFLSLAIAILLLVIKIFKNYNTRLFITNKKLCGEVGILSKISMVAPLNKINNITVKQSLLGRVFNYGAITANTSSGTFLYNSITNPKEFRKILMETIETFNESENAFKGKNFN